MPIVPVFGNGGSGPTPPSTPVWLEVATQVVALGTSSTGAITLNTPSNGQAPFTYRVLSYGNNDQTRTLIVNGNVLEINGTPGMVTAGNGANQSYRVLVWDSVGNFGVGVLFLYNNIAWANQILEEKVLDWDEDPNGYLFAGPRTPPAGWSFSASYNAGGDGFSYPIATTSATAIGDRFANCAPGSFVVLSYLTTGPSSANQLNLLVLRRKLDMANLHWSWSKTYDLLDWNNLSTWSPTVPLVNTAFATVVETIAATGKSYNLGRTAFASVAGLAPTLETATFSGGVATLESQNTAASTRVVVMSFRPELPNSSQTYREGSFGASIGLLARMKVTATITGESAAVDIRLGRDYSPSSGSGIRVAGTGSIYNIGGQPAVRISLSRGTFLLQQGTFRKSVWGGGTPFGLDILFIGGQSYVCAYPWDNAWTDYPEWDEDYFQPKADNIIGPSLVGDRSTNNTVNSPYPYGSCFPIDTTGGDLNGFSRNNGVHIAVTQGNAVNNGAKVVVENFQYYWKSTNLGVIR